MEEWRYSLEDAWGAMSAIALTLKNYMQQYIIEQFGCNGPEVELLQQEIETVYAQIQKIRERQ